MNPLLAGLPEIPPFKQLQGCYKTCLFEVPAVGGLLARMVSATIKLTKQGNAMEKVNELKLFCISLKSFNNLELLRSDCIELETQELVQWDVL